MKPLGGGGGGHQVTVPPPWGGGVARVFQGKLWYPPLMQANRTHQNTLPSIPDPSDHRPPLKGRSLSGQMEMGNTNHLNGCCLAKQ